MNELRRHCKMSKWFLGGNKSISKATQSKQGVVTETKFDTNLSSVYLGFGSFRLKKLKLSLKFIWQLKEEFVTITVWWDVIKTLPLNFGGYD